jgi:hypothetical protein
VEPETKPDDPWHIARPIPLRIGQLHRGRRGIWEKNWMPFICRGQLYITYHVAPQHVVLRVPAPGLPPRVVYKTATAEQMAGLPNGSIHGGPPALLVPSRLSGSGRSYYLGVLHVRQNLPNGIAMPHFLYMTEPEPPFRITQVSRKVLPLQTVDGRQPFAFVSGLWLDDFQGTVLLSYGASDAAARVLLMSTGEIEELHFGMGLGGR